MQDEKFAIGVQLYKMVVNNPKIKASLFSLAYRVIEMVHAEGFDPTTVDFQVMAIKGEENKLHLTLTKAEYTTKPLIEAPDDKVSSAIVRMVDSLYKAIGANSSMMGFLNVCPGLCDALYSVANYILEAHYSKHRKDFQWEIIWDCYDHWKEKDLVITGVFQ